VRDCPRGHPWARAGTILVNLRKARIVTNRIFLQFRSQTTYLSILRTMARVTAGSHRCYDPRDNSKRHSNCQIYLKLRRHFGTMIQEETQHETAEIRDH